MTKTEKSNPSAIELKVFGKLMTEKINFFKPPYNIRNNCQVGQWAKGEDELYRQYPRYCHHWY
jgi:hypothetical protein